MYVCSMICSMSTLCVWCSMSTLCVWCSMSTLCVWLESFFRFPRPRVHSLCVCVCVNPKKNIPLLALINGPRNAENWSEYYWWVDGTWWGFGNLWIDEKVTIVTWSTKSRRERKSICKLNMIMNIIYQLDRMTPLSSHRENEWLNDGIRSWCTIHTQFCLGH